MKDRIQKLAGGESQFAELTARLDVRAQNLSKTKIDASKGVDIAQGRKKILERRTQSNLLLRK